MASTVHLLTSLEKVVIGLQGVLGWNMTGGCASLASPVLHPPVQSGPPASPEAGSLREISPPNICTVFFAVRTSDNRIFICDLSLDCWTGIGRVPDLPGSVLIKLQPLQLNQR